MRPSGTCCAAGGGCCDAQHGQRLVPRHNRDTEKVVLGVIVVQGQRLTCVATVTTLSLSKLYGGLYKRVCEGVVEYCIGVLCMLYRIYENHLFLMLCCCGRGWGVRGAGGCAAGRCGGMVRLPAVFPPAAGRLAMSSGGGGLRIAAVIVSGASGSGAWCVVRGQATGGRRVWCVVSGAWCLVHLKPLCDARRLAAPAPARGATNQCRGPMTPTKYGIGSTRGRCQTLSH